MNTAVADPTVPAAALRLQEAGLLLREGALQPDGTVLVHIIRPGVGRGKGTHVYSREMLQRDAHVFAGSKMYMNHLSEAAQKALGGLPRPVEQLGGHIIESWWDDDVPADDRFDRGAVVGLARPTRFMAELIEAVPEAIATSINTDATGVKPTTYKGRRAYLVEGMRPPTDVDGSVDWVTQAGCGGRVVSQLQESAYDTEKEADMARFDSMTDEELQGYLSEERPDLLEAIRSESGTPSAPEGEDVGESEGTPGKEGEETQMAEITTDSLREALATEEGQKLILEAAQPYIQEAVSAAIDEERDDIAAAARADALRQNELYELRTLAHGMVEATRLPEEFKSEIRSEFDLSENGVPTSGLKAIFPEFDDEGAVTKTSREKLTEAVGDKIERMRKLHSAAAPARVRQAPRTETPPDGGDGDGDGGDDGAEAELEGRLPLTEALLRKSGVTAPLTRLYG